MRTLEGPGRFVGGGPAFDGSASIAASARDLGCADVQAPAFDPRQLDLERAASSRTDGGASRGPVAAAGVAITAPSAHPQCRLTAACPGDGLHDGAGCELFLDRVGRHRRALLPDDLPPCALPQPDHPANPDVDADRIGVFHVEDAELRPSARHAVHGACRCRADQAGPFRGVGEVDVGATVSALAAMDFDGGTAVPRAGALTHPADGALAGRGR